MNVDSDGVYVQLEKMETAAQTELDGNKFN